MKMKWNDISKIRMDILSITQEALAEKLGVTKGAVSHWLNGRRNPSLEEIADIFQHLGIAGAELNADGTFSVDEDQVNSTVVPQYFYPFYSTISAGAFSDVGSYTPMDSEKMIPSTTKVSDDSFWLAVEGHSMTAPYGASPSFPEGMLLLVDPNLRDQVKSGDFVIAGLNNDEATFKKYVVEDGVAWLEPLNDDRSRYRARNFNNGCWIIGKVVKAQWPEETFG